MQKCDVVVIGAGAAGMMCAATAAKRGRKVMLLDHAKKAGEKIRISGGGRCNFTNLHTTPANFLSDNPRFCVSALKRYTHWDFISQISEYEIRYHEKTLGQLFCDGSSQQIIDMLLRECDSHDVDLRLNCKVEAVEKTDNSFFLESNAGPISCESLVIATGGKSIPKMGATGFGYQMAEQFGLNIIEPRAALVPLRFGEDLLAQTKGLSGVSVDALVTFGRKSFREALLFTHRGLSGPAILQISSYWREGEYVGIDLAPGTDAFERLKTAKSASPKQTAATVLAGFLPKSLAQHLAEMVGCTLVLAETPDKGLRLLADRVNRWKVKPSGTEGYRTAEVTIGGVDTRNLSSKTFEANKVPGLYFIGEVVDVTGHLGGFNFQWAWSSGHCCGLYA